MTKLVNIYPSGPILGVNPPIRTIALRVKKTSEQIRECIMYRATVEEILNNGKVIRLNLSNYDKDNNPSEEDKKPDKKIDLQSKKEKTIFVADTVTVDDKVKIAPSGDKIQVSTEEPKTENEDSKSLEAENTDKAEDDSTDVILEEVSEEEPVKKLDIDQQIKNYENKYKKHKK